MTEEAGIGNGDKLEKRQREKNKIGEEGKQKKKQDQGGGGGKQGGKVMGEEETDNKKQKQMSLYHHLSGKGLSNAWAPPLKNGQALN